MAKRVNDPRPYAGVAKQIMFQQPVLACLCVSLHISVLLHLSTVCVIRNRFSLSSDFYLNNSQAKNKKKVRVSGCLLLNHAELLLT